MSLVLYRLGRWSYRNRWAVLGAWLTLLLVIVALVAGQGGARISSSITIDGTESEEVITTLHEVFPEMSGSQGTIVFLADADDRLDEGPAGAGLKELVEEINALDAVAQREDLTDRLPDLREVPADVDLNDLHGMIRDVPLEYDLANLKDTVGKFPDDVDVSELRATLALVPEGADLTDLGELFAELPQETDLEQLRQVLTHLPEGMDLPELQQRIGQIPPGANPQQVQFALGGLPEGLDLPMLQSVLAGLPAGIDAAALETLTTLPADVNLNDLSSTFAALPKGQDPGEMWGLLADLPDEFDLVEMSAVMADLPDTLDLDDLRTTLVDIPRGTDLNRLRELMDVDLLTVAGEDVPGVLLSTDGATAMFQIQLAHQIEDLPAPALEEIVTIAEAGAEDLGITALITESLKPQNAPLGGSEGIGLAVAALVLFLTLGTLRAAGLPLVTALIGVGVGLGGALALSHTVELTSATPVLALMVGLAVGIDYALFIVNRARQFVLNDGLIPYDATGRAMGTAGSAVVFAGLTVVIALSGLTLIGISFLSTMALVAAVTVALAVLVAISLLPALLGFLGDGLGARGRRAPDMPGTRRRAGFGDKWATTVVAHRGAFTIATIGLLAVAAIPAASMSFGMPSGSTANLDTSERQAYDAITGSFGEGYNAPLLTVTHDLQGDGIQPIDLPFMAQTLADLPGVDTARPMGLSSDGHVALISVIPQHGPDHEVTATLVEELRSAGADLLDLEGAAFGVAGLTAVNLDISEKLATVLPTYIAIIVALSLIVLLVVFRSVLIPIKATVGFLLSIGATFGIVTAIFQWGWLKELLGFDTTGPILSFLPIMVTGILYGLAMDYEMFLVSSMREAHVHGHSPNGAIIRGFEQSSRVVVAAAAIMVAVFAGFILSSDPMVKQFGTALAIGIFIDAFIIRLTLVPAVMSYLGGAAWWLPRWVQRSLPNLDVEGAKLREHLTQKEPHPARVNLPVAP